MVFRVNPKLSLPSLFCNPSVRVPVPKLPNIHILVDKVAPKIVKKLVNSHFFWKGWGEANLLRFFFQFAEQELNREPGFFLKNHTSFKKQPRGFLHQHLRQPIKVQVQKEKVEDEHVSYHATFESPLAHWLPEESKLAYFQLLLPKCQHSNNIPVCILLSGTGEQSFWQRRELIARPLLKKRIGSLILMNPYYGLRKPAQQNGSRLLHVTDLLAMGGALITETNALMDWLHSERGLGPFGLSGFSMGGLMACLSGTIARRPVALIPLLAPHSATPIFTTGLYRDNVKWDVLEEQLGDFRKEGLASEDDTSETFIQRILDGTDLRNYPFPVVPEAVFLKWGKYDQFIPETPDILSNHWKESQYVSINGGHISSYYFKQRFENSFSDVIHRAMDILSAKHPAHTPLIP